MSAYPIAIDTFRATANLPGLTYNPLDTKTIFAEDLQGLQSSVVAIETELGPTPKGGSANVANRLDDTVAKNGDTMTGPLTVNARIKAGPGSDVIVIDPNGNDYLQMFHSGGAAGYGQLASSTGFVIISGAGRSAAMTSSGAVQCIFQETATWQSVDIGHDGM